mmetsp:Transcript_35069/g.98483  ORF Transcript_35069/g.98483 Transcript_35069/m.98483 type:complete len:255 (-) Transcript_35069:88-852(-)
MNCGSGDLPAVGLWCRRRTGSPVGSEELLEQEVVLLLHGRLILAARVRPAHAGISCISQTAFTLRSIRVLQTHGEGVEQIRDGELRKLGKSGWLGKAELGQLLPHRILALLLLVGILVIFVVVVLLLAQAQRRNDGLQATKGGGDTQCEREDPADIAPVGQICGARRDECIELVVEGGELVVQSDLSEAAPREVAAFRGGAHAGEAVACVARDLAAAADGCNREEEDVQHEGGSAAHRAGSSMKQPRRHDQGGE